MKHVRRILILALALLLTLSSSAWAEELHLIIDEPAQYAPVYEWMHPSEPWGVELFNAYYGTFHYSRELTDAEKAAFVGHGGLLVSLDTGRDYSQFCECWCYENMFAVGVNEELPAGKYEYTLIHAYENTNVYGKCIIEIGE